MSSELLRSNFRYAGQVVDGGPNDGGKRTRLAPGVRNTFICLWQEVNAPDDAAVAAQQSHVVPPKGPPHVPSCLFDSTVSGERQ